MSENERNKIAAGDAEEWAIIPFDEAEDDARWSKLIEETDQLIAKTRELETVHGKILTENKLGDLKFQEVEDGLF